ncbi:MAG: tripartite tricarboxylate transporter substrate-binding protein [Spirochaetota bacterium]|nr:tripartite tricarboxylate transporter substrate-binding protein [Spirochaetota bacterium]
MPLFSAGETEVASTDVSEKIHFLIPGGAGGGWDGTARGTGEALTKSGLIKTASYENLSGGGGGKAIAHLIETAERQHGTLMVNSTPIVVRSLTKVFPYSFRDLTPIASVIADFAAFVVPADSPIKDWNQVVKAIVNDPASIRVAGGSVRGDLDHIAVAMAFKAAGVNPVELMYIPYDAGGKALAGLLSGETEILSTGLGEVLGMAKSGQVRILAITAEERMKDLPDVPTLVELGYDVTFANWRGFFGAPDLPGDTASAYAELLKKMYDTPEWETVRSRNGWANLYKAGPDFYSFLENQEDIIGGLMRELGFLE